MKLLPIGIDDFAEVINNDYYYIDKTLFIQELLNNKVKATLIPRPRRFGKTLNLSMLYYFFKRDLEPDYSNVLLGSKSQPNSNTALFNNCAIAHDVTSMAHQGRYPVIFFTLKFIEGSSWDECFEKLKKVIAHEYEQHSYLLDTQLLNDTKKNTFNAIMAGTAGRVAYELSLKHLTEYLSQYYKQRVIVLIDEYDVPMQAGFRHNYYDKVAAFTRSFFGDALKGNNHLDFAVLTGALRIAKESIFTGLNNLEVNSVLSSHFADKFGLLEHEVLQVLADYKINVPLNDVRSWYNGYTIGEHTVYNPWSIINFTKQGGTLQPYWINTSTNDIIKKLIQHSDEGVKQDIETLIARKTITKEIRENIVYADIEKKETVLWNFLVFSGYLTFKNRHLVQETTYFDLYIPNDEVTYFFKSTISSWFEELGGDKNYRSMLNYLVTGDIQTFSKLFTTFVLNALSYFDVSGNQPEKFYHAFVLGMLVQLADRYEITSNRESGYGRYDVMIQPHDTTKIGIVIEFKKVDTYDQETLEQAAANALVQINEKNYAQEMIARGISTVRAVGIAFDGKKVLIRSA